MGAVKLVSAGELFVISQGLNAAAAKTASPVAVKRRRAGGGGGGLLNISMVSVLVMAMLATVRISGAKTHARKGRPSCRSSSLMAHPFSAEMHAEAGSVLDSATCGVGPIMRCCNWFAATGRRLSQVYPVDKDSIPARISAGGHGSCE
jgi:hypothetical protein